MVYLERPTEDVAAPGVALLHFILVKGGRPPVGRSRSLRASRPGRTRDHCPNDDKKSGDQSNAFTASTPGRARPAQAPAPRLREVGRSPPAQYDRVRPPTDPDRAAGAECADDPIVSPLARGLDVRGPRLVSWHARGNTGRARPDDSGHRPPQ